MIYDYIYVEALTWKHQCNSHEDLNVSREHETNRLLFNLGRPFIRSHHCMAEGEHAVEPVVGVTSIAPFGAPPNPSHAKTNATPGENGSLVVWGPCRAMHSKR